MSATTTTDQVVIIEALDESHPCLIYPADEWRIQLDDIAFPLDGGGGLALLALPSLAVVGYEVAFALAVPEGCRYGSEGGALELSLQHGAHETDPAYLIVTHAIADSVLDRERLLFTALDVGANRAGLRALAAQEQTRLLALHPRSGDVLRQGLMLTAPLRRRLAQLLAQCEQARPATPNENTAAMRRVYQGMDAQSAWPPFAKVGRNDPCPCGSGVRSKRCCDA